MGTPQSDFNLQPVSTRLGDEVRRLRKAAGLTQHDLADRVYYSRSYIALIETGREKPSAEAVERIAKELRDDGALRSLYSELTSFSHVEDTSRFEFGDIKHSEAMSSPLAVGRSVDPESVESLRVLLVEYAKIDNLLGPRRLIAVLSAQLRCIDELLLASSGPARSDMLRIASRYAEFTG